MSSSITILTASVTKNRSSISNQTAEGVGFKCEYSEYHDNPTQFATFIFTLARKTTEQIICNERASGILEPRFMSDAGSYIRKI